MIQLTVNLKEAEPEVAVEVRVIFAHVSKWTAMFSKICAMAPLIRA